MTRRLLTLLVFLAAVTWCPGAGQKHKTYLVTFHLEASEDDNPKFTTPVKLGKEHRQYFFDKIPTFTDKDIAWFYPFTAEDGASYGAAFQLEEHAATQLKALTLTNQGKLLGLRIADAPLQAVLIDRPITDGVVVTWSGIQQKHLKEFRKRFPHVDDIRSDPGPRFALPGQ